MWLNLSSRLLNLGRLFLEGLSWNPCKSFGNPNPIKVGHEAYSHMLAEDLTSWPSESHRIRSLDGRVAKMLRLRKLHVGHLLRRFFCCIL